MQNNPEFDKIIEKMGKKFCPDCDFICQHLNESGTQCSFAPICAKSLHILKKHKPIYFTRHKS